MFRTAAGSGEIELGRFTNGPYMGGGGNMGEMRGIWGTILFYEGRVGQV